MRSSLQQRLSRSLILGTFLVGALLGHKVSYAESCYQLVEGAAPTELVEAYPTQSPITVWNGETFAVFWRASGGSLSMATFDTSGQLVQAPKQVIESVSDTPTVVWTGAEYGLIWSSSSTSFARLSADGTLIGDLLVLPINACCVALSWTGNGYGLMYLQWLADSPFYLFVDAEGQPALPAVALDVGPRVPRSLIWNNGEFGLLLEFSGSEFGPDDEITFVRLDIAGQMLDTPRLITAEAEYGGPMVWTGLDYRVPWFGDVLNLARLSATGSELLHSDSLDVTEPVLVDTSYAYTGGTSVHAWRRDEPGNRDHGVILIDPNEVDAGEPIHLVTQTDLRPLGLGYSGQEVGVAWADAPTPGALYFQVLSCCIDDVDDDGYRSCEECDDSNADIHPAAPQRCDRVNNDCDDPAWPSVPDSERDRDGDGLTPCEGDCDDRQPTVYPGAPQIDCDVMNNDCLEPSWPALLADEADPDGDGLGATCDNCPTVPNTPLFDFEASPMGWTSVTDGAADTWHRSGETCYGDPLPSTMFVSNGNAGAECQESTSHESSLLVSPWLRIPGGASVQLDLDALSFDEAGECAMNPTQLDWKNLGINTVSDPAIYTTLNDCSALTDGLGNLLHHSFDVSAWAGQDVRIVIDYDTFDERVGHTLAIDNVALTVNGVVGQQDTDRDGFGDACDTCVLVPDRGQIDSDFDLEGDACDLDDGAIYLLSGSTGIVWGDEAGFESWNVYRGSLAGLRSGGDLTQQPGINDLAARFCEQAEPGVDDGLTLGSQAAAFYLVSGNQAGIEGDLGVNSQGDPRPNTAPCSR